MERGFKGVFHDLVLIWLKERKPTAHRVIEVVPESLEISEFSVGIYYWDDDWDKCFYGAEGAELMSLWKHITEDD